MKRLFSIAIIILSSALAVAAQDVTGDWNGKLSVNGGELRLVLHIAKNADGSLKATLDSVDQGANGIPVSSITLKDSKLNLEVGAVNGSYEGKVNTDASEIAGTWTQGASLPLNFHRGVVAAKPKPKPAKASDIDGDWFGTIDTGVSRLRVVLHILNTEDGLNATMDSLDQNAKGIPVTSITRNGSSLKFEIKTIGGSYDGAISTDLSAFTGTWSQLGKSFPLVLKRVKDTSELELRRPQTPAKPYPYKEEEVSYKNPTANIELAATISIPEGKGPFPAVLLMAGSGPHDRDESIMGHKPFLVLADYLTRKGIVVLRADKRGVGKSGGDYSQAVMTDFASDADAGVAYLKTRAEVEPHKIGLIGHSEGAVEAPMSAARNPNVAFVVMMAGPGVSGDQLLPEQMRRIEEASGKSKDEIEKDVALQSEILAMVERDKDDAALDKDLREKLAGKVPEAQMGMQVKAVSSPWFRRLLQYDPAPVLSKLTCPVLVLNGEKDVQVPPQQNLPPIRKALESGGNKNFEIEELPGLNHLFQTAKTGGIAEYSEIEETMSPIVLEKVASWIVKHASSTSPTAANSQAKIGVTDGSK
jgi:pimeloyl-ACP methyl ester carboxylesterase